MMKLFPSGVLAVNLLRLRWQRRVSLSEVAEASGVSLGALSRIESGRGNPRLSTLEAVADALNVEVEALFQTPTPRIHVARAHEMAKRHVRGLTTRSAGHISAGGVDLELSVVRIWKPDWVIKGGNVVEHLLVLNGEIQVDFGDEIVTVSAGDYLRFDGDFAHQYKAVKIMAQAVVVTERRG